MEKNQIFALNRILLVEDDVHISEVIHDYFVRESGGKLQVVVSDNAVIDCEPSELWEPLKKGNTARTGHTGNGLGNRMRSFPNFNQSGNRYK